MAKSRNWANLPRELACLISKKLPADRAYGLRFRAVCKNWRSAVPPSDLPPLLPWLIERGQPDQDSYLGPNLRFYSLTGNHTGTIHVPEAYHDMLYYGPGHGYLLVSSSENDLFLLDPLAGELISLPKLNDELSIQCLGVSGSDPIRNLHVSCDMPEDDIVGRITAVYNADQNEWTYVEVGISDIPRVSCCWNGKVFATEYEGDMMVFDAVSGAKLPYEALPPPEDESQENRKVCATYLVESCGEILRVICYFNVDGTEEFVRKFDIYKLHSEGEGQHKERSWIKVSDIGDQMLFLDQMKGFSMRAPAGFKGNCIYFLYEDIDTADTPSRYDLGTGQVETLPCPLKHCTWLIPNLC